MASACALARPTVVDGRSPRAFCPPSPSSPAIDKIRSHLTRRGLATELDEAEKYEPDGYWRGPIWAPSTYLVHAGPRSVRASALAAEAADRFVALCRQSGFAENFDALSGAALRDRAYTWTASVYLLLAASAP